MSHNHGEKSMLQKVYEAVESALDDPTSSPHLPKDIQQHIEQQMRLAPSDRLMKAIENWRAMRADLARAEFAMHAAQMELIRAEDEERKTYAITESNR